MSGTSTTPFPLGVDVGNPNISDQTAEATFDASNEAFATLMGTQTTYMNTAVDSTQPISDWISNQQWFAESAAASPTFQGKIPTIALPMSSTAAGSPSADQMFKNFAAGDYDSVLQGMVKAWAAEGFKTQYWRPGVEMNLPSSASYSGDTASEQADWVAAFQHIYTTLHAAAAADGVNLKVIWNPGMTNYSDAGNPTETLYPGNSYVDILGIDVYGDVFPYGSPNKIYDWDKSGQELNSPNPVYDTSVQQWASDPVNLEHYYTDPASSQWSLDDSGGSALSLQDFINFAKAEGKPIAIAETGAGNTLDDDSGLTDNPTFVQWLSSTLESAGVPIEYVNIWDSDLGGNYAFSDPGDDKPLEEAAWAKYFGVQTTTSSSSTGSSSSGSTTGTPSGSTSSSTTTTGSSSGSTTTTTPTSHTLTLQMSEDYYKADAEFTVDVNGKQVGGTYSASALHSSGDGDTFVLTGNWNSGANTVQINFINDAFGGTASTDRNLYVNSIAYDGVTYKGTSATMDSNGSHTFTVGGSTATATAPADSLTLNLSEQAYQGNAEFELFIDGKQVSSPQVVSALNEASATQAFSFTGNLGAGKHTIGIDYLNADNGGSAGQRDLYINGIALNGATVFSGSKLESSNGMTTFTVTTTH
jgi:hypothetical protein